MTVKLQNLATGARRALLACGVAASGIAGLDFALAQTGQSSSIPGLIISTPGWRPPEQQAEEPKPKPPKRKPTARSKPQREASAAPASASSGQGIVALVNDEPITAYEVQQRAAFLLASGGGSGVVDRAQENMKQLAQSDSINQRMRALLDETIKDNPGKTRDQVIAAFEERKKQFVQSLQQQALANARSSLLPSYKKKALEELVEERLKLQEAKRLNLAVSDADADKMLKGIAERNKMTEQQFVAHLKGQGIDANTMKARLKAQAAWRDVIRRKFGPQIAVTARDVDKYVAASGSDGEDLLELQLQKITLSVPGKIDQKVMAQRLEEAEALRRKFAGCKSTAALAKGVANAKFEDLGYRTAGSIPEPTRSLLLSAKDNQMVPGNLAQSGVELYAVCGRRTAKADEQKRQQVQEELTQKEFDVLARRHLRDLRQDALIEYR